MEVALVQSVPESARVYPRNKSNLVLPETYLEILASIAGFPEPVEHMQPLANLQCHQSESPWLLQISAHHQHFQYIAYHLVMLALVLQQ